MVTASTYDVQQPPLGAAALPPSRSPTNIEFCGGIGIPFGIAVEAWTFPSYVAALRERASREGLYWTAALNEGEPVGVAFAFVADGEATLISARVAQPWRRRGIATRLVDDLVSLVGRHPGVVTVTVRFTEPDDAPHPLRGVLARSGFPALKPRFSVYYFDLRTLSAAPWLRPDGLRGPLRLSRWHGLPSTAIDELRRRIAEENFCPESLVPGASEYYDATASFALRDERGRVIGWTLCERPDHDTVVVANLFVDPGHWRRGGIAWLVHATVAAGLAAGMSRGSFMTSTYFAPMMAFAERRLRPYASSVRISFEASRTLPARPQESAIEAACLEYR